MNKTFKTIWNDARRCFIVANETQKSHGKPSKSAVALAVAATALFSTVASAAYIEKGFVAQNSSQVADAQKSWESDEYKKDWGLTAMNASKAYALGFTGQNTKVAVMDSGALLQKHPELAGDRFSATHVTGEYGMTGNRYPQSVTSTKKGQPFEKGEKFDVTGQWIPNTNCSHGTHVLGTVGANRDGNEFHGVAFGADIVSGNTGATDSNNYGPYQDYDFFYKGWKALADDLTASNGEHRGGVINNSWGTNIKVVQVYQLQDVGNGKLDWVYHHNLKPGEDTSSFVEQDQMTDKGAFTTATGGIPADTLQESEYEYFYHKKMYKDQYAGTDHAGKSFVDAAYDAVKGTNVVQIFTTGNVDRKNPFYRPLYPYFNPEAEKHWIAVAGLYRQRDENKNYTGEYALESGFVEAGLGKYWTVAAPSNGVYSSVVYDNNILGTSEKNPLGKPSYNSFSGTSMAAPHVAGAMGVLMSRYQDMTALQVRDVMFTTANHKKQDGVTDMDGWANVDKTVPTDGQVSDRMGWGVPDLDKGMYGPGQFLGKFDYNMSNTKLDVWSNNVTNVALDQRKAEDQEWLKNYDDNLAKDDYELGNNFVIKDGTEDQYDHIIDKEDAKKWRAEYYAKRKAAIEAKLANGEYEGSLVKRGQGTLVMTGNNTYRGGTTVEEGTLLGFNDSFGVTGQDSSAKDNGKVTVNGGIFGVMNAYNDQFTMKGEIKDDKSEHSVDVDVKAGGTYGVVAGQSVEVGKLTFEKGATLTVVSADSSVLVDAFNKKEGVIGSVKADSIVGGDLTVTSSDYAFFDADVKVDGNTLNSTLKRNDASVATYAHTDAGVAIAEALEKGTDSKLFADLVSSNKAQITNTLDSLDSDLHMAFNNATVANTASLARVIKDQASAYGQARTAELDNGIQLWATGIGNWSKVDAGGASVDMDVDYYAGLVGAEVLYGNNNKVGVFFGSGNTKGDASLDGKVESDDLHLGVYGENAWDALGVTYGLTYTAQDRDAKRSLFVKDQLGYNAVSYDADVMQVFGEVSYKGFNSDAFTVEPYAGLSYMKISADSFTEKVGSHEFKTQLDDQKVGTVNVGVRGAMPFAIGGLNMAVKGDVGYMQFFGDKESTAKMTLGDAGTANLKGEELSGMGAVGLGVDAAIGKNTTIGISYTGALGSDITSHGVGATLRVKF